MISTVVYVNTPSIIWLLMKFVCLSSGYKLFVELNKMPGRPLREKVMVSEEDVVSGLPVVTTVPDIADHPLGNYLRKAVVIR